MPSPLPNLFCHSVAHQIVQVGKLEFAQLILPNFCSVYVALLWCCDVYYDQCSAMTLQNHQNHGAMILFCNMKLTIELRNYMWNMEISSVHYNWRQEEECYSEVIDNELLAFISTGFFFRFFFVTYRLSAATWASIWRDKANMPFPLERRGH